ncbi:hypothetical protein JKF63_04791 [Porcisia hertigi]|uniref:RING-type domain-containing protein n=1 Tax=Porcisia hertigi TaxID=2761500 RepID=A0A836HR46_9TRYP|nr:hypothetical protein JKF63_04791 [Porcisia hertigi]
MSIDAHPYSAVDLVRVHRLKGIPTHKRGLYSGLVNRCFTTRSGHYTIGRGSDEHGRVRSGVSGFLLGVRRHTDALSLSPPRLKMQSICTDSEVLFQWTEGDDAQYAVFEEDEMLAPHRSGRSASRNLSRTSDLLVLSLKQFLERTYGKQMSAEQREEAVRLLRERRGTQHRKSGGHPPLDSKKADGGRHLLSTEGAMMALEEFLQNEANAGSFGVGESRHQRRTKSNAISGSESASPNSKHQVIVVQDLSPTVLESDSSMNPPILATETMSHNCGDQLLDTMAPGHLLSLGADGGGSRHLVDGEESTSTLATSSPYSSCRTSNPEGAAALRRKRQARLKLIDSIARSGSGGDDRCVPLGKLRRSSRDANRFLLGLDFDAQSPKSTDAAPFDMREETVGPVERPTTAPGEPQSDAHRISSVGAGANSDMGETAGLGVGGDDRFDTGDVKKVFSKARTSAGRGVPALKTQEHSSEPVSGVAVAAAGSSLEDPPKGSPNHSREDSPKSDPIDSESTGSLNEFLMLFPEQKNHVELRRTAKSILDGVEEMWDDNDMKDFLLPNFQHSNWEHSRRDDLAGAGNADELPREPSEDLKEDDSFTGFCVSDEALIAKFRIDAEEEFSALVARRDALRAELADQSTLLRDFGEDAHYLSVGEARSGMTAEQYAIALTHMVHSYSLSHRLHLNCALEETIAREVHGDCKEDNNVEGAAEGFLDHFWRGRSDMVDVGCQVSDADLCYVDAAVRSTEQKLEDLILHERALVGAVRLTTVAVANIMAFHASLEMESTCRECFYVFNKPRTLWPCGHTFCFACLTNMYNSRGELICSECGSICETGYTPNIAIELISNYQTLCQRDETHSGIENGGAIVEERSQTIEGVLRSLLNELLAAQSSWSTHLAV